MFENAQKVNWTDVRESVPIFLVTALVPFTYSLFYGVSLGLAMHIVFKLCSVNFWRRHAPSWLLIALSRCQALINGRRCDYRNDSGLYDHLRDEFGLHRIGDADDDDTRSEPLFFDNPYFDFHPAPASTGRSSDDGSDFFGISYHGIGLHTIGQNNIIGNTLGESGARPEEGGDDDDGDDAWYRSVSVEGH